MEKTADIFISHSSKDKTLADSICRLLEERDLKCWIAPRNIVAGKRYGQSIIEGIQCSRIMLVIFTEEANKSEFVHSEVERAFHYKLPILPFRTGHYKTAPELELFMSTAHWLDATQGEPSSHIEQLALNCAILCGKETRTPEERASALLDKADELFRNGKYQEARNIIAQVLRFQPGNEEALYLEGLVERSLEKESDMKTDLKQVNINPILSGAGTVKQSEFLDNARVLFSNKQNKAALYQVNAILKKDPTNEEGKTLKKDIKEQLYRRSNKRARIVFIIYILIMLLFLAAAIASLVS